ncbi:uncharacterized protein LOC110859251 isoform X2 [Folsomia candida]|uniref:uncharacterized protein LOC110859251 isoform X2 n=1 Tax=Folsomia candida TaxID=158441 RepID=UPI001604DB6E|nr:uncharacterized protein LOC110859251 isoform X2 [Folsomia candida]
MPWKKGRKRTTVKDKTIIPAAEVSPPLQEGTTTGEQVVSTTEEQSLEVQDDLLGHIVPDPRNIPDIPPYTLKLPILPLEKFNGKHVDIDELQGELENMLVAVVKRKALLMAMNGYTPPPPPEITTLTTPGPSTRSSARGRRGISVVSVPTMETSEGRSLIRAALVMKVEPPDIEEEEPTEKEMENDRVKDSFNELADQHVAEITPSMMEFLQNLWQDGQYDNLLASNPKKIEPTSAGACSRSHQNNVKTDQDMKIRVDISELLNTGIEFMIGYAAQSDANCKNKIANLASVDATSCNPPLEEPSSSPATSLPKPTTKSISDLKTNKKLLKKYFKKSDKDLTSEECNQLVSEYNSLCCDNAKQLCHLLDIGKTCQKYYEVKKRVDQICDGMINVQKGMTEIKRSIRLDGDPDGDKGQTLQALRKEAMDLLEAKSAVMPQFEKLESMLFGTPF